MSHLTTAVEPVADDRLKLICMHCGSTVPPRRRGWAATCLDCQPEPTAEDWRDYERAAAALDEPDPSLTIDFDARYGPDYDPAEYAPLCGLGHPASED